MLDDLMKSVAAVGETDAAMAREIDAFLLACVRLMNEAGSRKERLAAGAQVAGGQMSLTNQIHTSLVDAIGGTAQQAYGAIVGHVTSGAASLLIEKQRQDKARLTVLRGKSND